MLSLKAIETRIARLEGQQEAYEAELEKLALDGKAATAETETLATILRILQGMETAWRERFAAGLEGIVSRGLTAVFGEEIKVRLETTTTRDTTNIAIKVEERGIEMDAMDSTGGSLVQVLAFLLLVLMIVSAQPPLARVIALDEPFGMVNDRYFPRLCQLITGLRQSLGMQFIMTTHNLALLACAERAYVVELEGGKSTIRALEVA